MAGNTRLSGFLRKLSCSFAGSRANVGVNKAGPPAADDTIEISAANASRIIRTLLQRDTALARPRQPHRRDVDDRPHLLCGAGHAPLNHHPGTTALAIRLR